MSEEVETKHVWSNEEIDKAFEKHGHKALRMVRPGGV